MKFKGTTMKKLLTNRTVLNVVFVIALLNIIGYLMIGNIHEVVYFILVALLTSYFSKNMIIVLGVPLILVNLFSLRNSRQREGFDQESKENTKEDKDNTKEDTKEDTKDNTKEDKNDKNNKNDKKEEEPFEVGRNVGNNTIDYASTVEDAYNDLNKIIGSEGIKRLTDDTQNLMKQQLELTKAMQGMGPLMAGLKPLMSQATELMGTMGEKGGLDKLIGMANQLNVNPN